MFKRSTFFTIGVFLFFAFLLPSYAQSVPGLSAPVNGSTWDSTTPTLYWWYSPTPYSAGPFSYTVQVSTDQTNFTGLNLKVNTTVSSGVTGSYAVTSGAGLVTGTTYYWRVGVGSDFSTVSGFTPSSGGVVITTAPAAPVPSSPTYGETNVSVSPTFSWYASGADSYTLQVSLNSLFSSFVIDQSGLTSASYPASGLANSTVYYWRVNATNTYGTSAYSTVYNFTTEAAAIPPSIPTLASPADVSTNIGNHPTLYWHPASGATTYTLLVSSDNFSTIDFTFSGITDTAYHIHSWPSDYLLLNQQYHWKVSATNTYGTSAYSSVWSFTTKSSPDAPDLVSPLNNTTDLSILPTLVWTKEFGATSYDLQVATNSTFTTGLQTFSTIADTTYTLASPLAVNTTYYWRVRSNAGSSSAYTSYWRFKTAAYSTWYVRTGGNDGNSGLTSTDAYLTIQHAIDGASAGDKIDVGAGTFTEDLIINTSNLEIYGTGYSATTTIKGVAFGTDIINLPAIPNIDIHANGVKIHDFKIESPTVTAGQYASGIVFDGTDLEFYNNDFHSSVNKATPLVQGDGYCIVMQSWHYIIFSNNDISGLKIYDNIFTYEDAVNSPSYGSYEGIFLNPAYDAAFQETNILVQNNTFSGNCFRGIATQTSGTTISNNIVNSSIATPNRGIWIIEGNNVTVNQNEVSGFDRGMGFGSGFPIWATFGNNVVVTENDIHNNTTGISVAYDFTGIANSPIPLLINNNSIYNNSTAGLDVSGSTGGGTGNFVYLDATNNWWGSTSGPTDATFWSTSNEMPAGSATPVETWINTVDESATNPLGDLVVDKATDPAVDGLHVEYYPWNGGTPVLTVGSTTTVTGATVSIPVTLGAYGLSFQTLQGKFTYDPAKLDYVSASYGTGTLINASGWTILFNESPAGTINFVGVGFTPIASSGTLFKLNFQVIALTAGSANISVNDPDFKVDGTPSVLTCYSGTITYTFQQYTYMRGDVDLDGIVDLDDALLLDQYLSTLISLSTLQKQNADADQSGSLDANDISTILYYVLYGSWPVAPVAPSVANVSFGNIGSKANNLIDLPIELNSSSNVRNVEMIVNYDKKAMDFQTFSQLVNKTGHFVEATKIVDGVARFTYVAPEGQTGNFTPGSIVMRLKNSSYNGGPITTFYKINSGEFKKGPTYSIDGVTSVETNNSVPTEYELSQNYPNPFNPTTRINYALPQNSYVTIRIYNMLGQEIKTLVQNEMSAGVHVAEWRGDSNNGNIVASGIYIYRLTAGKYITTKKMLYLK